MKRSWLNVALVTLVGGTLLIGCSKDNQTKVEQPGKNPPSLQGENAVEKGAVRTAMDVLTLDSSFESKIQAKGLYTPDNCIQWVKITKGDQEIGTYLELSAVTCPSTGVVADADVLIRLKVQQHAQYFTQYHVIEEQSGTSLGVFRRLSNQGTTGPAVITFVLEGLCDIQGGGVAEDYSSMCAIELDNSSFRKPNPLTWSPNL